MEAVEAHEFHDKVVGGTEYHRNISLEHQNGYRLEDVKMTVVPKTVLADVISTMPDDVFDAARDEDMDADDVEEMDESQAGNLIDSEVVGSFVHLCDNSLVHTELAGEEMQDIIDELGFNTLFELGSEIMEMSIENTGEIRDFRKQS